MTAWILRRRGRARRSCGLDTRGTIALALLAAVFLSGAAHASRLCGVAGHADATRDHAAAMPCAAHHAAPSSGQQHAHPDHATPSCCAGHLSLAAIPAARPHDGALARTATWLPIARATTAADRVGPLVTVAALPRWSPHDPRSGPRLYLAQRVLLI